VTDIPDGFIDAEHMYDIKAWRTGTAIFAMGPAEDEFMFFMIEGMNVHDGTTIEFYFRAPLDYAESIGNSIIRLMEE
jgi:hypothetical protein